MGDLPAPRLGDRTLFPTLAARAYLSHAAISPVSEPVRRSVQALLGDYAAEGLGAFSRWNTQRDRLRVDLAALLGARPEDLALVANTTTAVLDVAQCFPWRPGDKILCFEGEFPTNVTPWQRAAATFDLEVLRLPLAGFDDGSGAGLARVEETLQGGGVRLIAVSAVQFQTGLAMPLQALATLAHAHGAQLAVDAIQAVGIRPLDVEALGIDYLACGSHKWLMGLEGCGFLYVRPERMASLVPRVAGWLSHEEAFAFLTEGPGHLRHDRPIRRQADFLEVGAPHGAALAALGASVSLLRTLGIEGIAAHVQHFHDALEPGLVARGFASLRATDPAARSGILSLRPPAGIHPGRLVEALGAHGVVVTQPCGLLRIAPHWPNALEEVDTILAAVDTALRSARA